MSLIYTLSTACGSGADDDTDEFESTSTYTTGQQKQQLPETQEESLADLDKKTCVLSGIAQCPSISPFVFSACAHIFTEISEGNATQCDYATCYEDKVHFPSTIYHAECVNAACPALAVDLGRLRKCATELRDENLECMRRNNCSQDACPLLAYYIERQRFMSNCLSR